MKRSVFVGIALSLLVLCWLILSNTDFQSTVLNSSDSTPGTVSASTSPAEANEVNPLDSDSGTRVGLGTVAELTGFRGWGAVDVFSIERVDAPIRLTWKCDDDGGEVSCEVEGDTWACVFPGEAYRLERASTGLSDMPLVIAASVSAADPMANIELAGPGTHLLDVYAGPARDQRIRTATVSVELPTDESLSEMTIAVSNRRPGAGGGRAERGGTNMGSGPLDASGLWALPNQTVPIVLPANQGGKSLLVSAAGCDVNSMDLPEEPGVSVVVLQPKRRLYVRLRSAEKSDSSYQVDVMGLGGRSLGEAGSLQAGSTHTVPLGEEAQVQVKVYSELDLGTRSLVFTQEVQLNPLLDTSVELDLAGLEVTAEEGTLGITVVSPVSQSGIEGWSAELIPVERSGLTPLRIARHKEYLRSWRVVFPLREYATEFSSVSPGDYCLLIEPLGLRRRLTVQSGLRVDLQVEVPELSLVTVSAVGSSGKLAGDAKGSIAWMLLSEESRGRETEHEAYELSSSDGKVSVDLLLGYARFAHPIEGGWRFLAPSNYEVLVRFVGPSVYGAEDLSIVLDPGPVEYAMYFKNL